MGEFLNAYKVDVDSVVIGLELNQSLRSQFRFPPLSPTEETQSPNTAHTSAQFKELKLSGSRESYQTKDYSALRDRIIALSEYTDAELVHEEVKEIASWLRQERNMGMKKGDVVVAQWTNKNDSKAKITYCRVLQWMNESTIKLHNGRSTVMVDAVQCQPLPMKVKESICRGHISQCILDHYQVVKENIMEKGGAFLLDHIFDTFEHEDGPRLRESLKNNGANLKVFDIEALKELSVVVENVDVVTLGQQEGFFQRCTKISSSYIDSISLPDICARDIDNIMSKLLNVKLQFVHFFTEVFNNISEQVKSNIVKLEQQCEQYLSGDRKNAMSTQWHNSVRECVNITLDRLGYAADAAPHDYISQPPSDIKLIEENLAILQCLLKNSDGNDELGSIARSLRARFYPQILDFEQGACEIASYKMGYTMCQEFEDLQAILDGEKGEFDKRIKDMLSDVVYLREMRRLEDNPMEKSRDIVPISGLVISSVARKEKEMQTILEVWQNI